MFKVREINSPAALAACGVFLVPEPFGACFVLAAAIWWLWRKIGRPWGHPLLLFRKRMVLGVLARSRKMRVPVSDSKRELNETLHIRKILMPVRTITRQISRKNTPHERRSYD
jgi:hypothetical protein